MLLWMFAGPLPEAFLRFLCGLLCLELGEEGTLVLGV